MRVPYKHVSDCVDAAGSDENLGRRRAGYRWRRRDLPSLVVWQTSEAESHGQADKARHTERGGDAQDPLLPVLVEDALIQDQDNAFERENEHKAAGCQLLFAPIQSRYLLSVPRP